MRRSRPLRPVWPRLAAGLAQANHLLIALDFDGTLAPLVSHPARAKLGPEIRLTLRELSRLKNVFVSIVSGRPVSWLKKKFPGMPLYLVGRHGLEMRGPRFNFRHPVLRQKHKQISVLSRWFASHKTLFPGLYLEKKGMSCAAHFRKMSPRNRLRFHQWLANEKNGLLRDIEIRSGKMVVEFMPRVSWNKGSALNFMQQHFQADRVLMVGDDRTDEDMFRIARGHDVSVRVGEGTTQAEYELPRQSDVVGMLKTLSQKLSELGKHA